MEGDGGDLGGQREDDEEVADRQQVGLARRQPLARGSALALGAVPVAAAVVGDANDAAVVASVDVAAQRGFATPLDSRHDLELMQAQMPGMSCSVGWAGGTEDIGDLEEAAQGVNRPACPHRS